MTTKLPTIELRFLFSDEDLFVLQKPAGCHSVSLSPDDYSLGAALLAFDAHLGAVAPRPGDGGLVQRLDFDTSGVIVGARTQDTWQRLHRQFQVGEILKEYLIIVDGAFPTAAECTYAVGSPNRGAHKVRVFRSPPRKRDRALDACSKFELLSYKESSNAALVRALAPTARRHQIRAHAGALGHPLTGDSLYGSTRQLTELLPGLARAYFLHASTITFTHPRHGTTMTILDPLPTPAATLFGYDSSVSHGAPPGSG